MNIFDVRYFCNNIQTLNDSHLLMLEEWLEASEGEKDRDEKLRLIDIELERREKLKKRYE